MASRLPWEQFTFFDKHNIHDNVCAVTGAPVTCATAEGGLLIFGDNNGRVTIADRNCVAQSQHPVFKGKVFGIAYIVDKGNQARQFIITIGEEQVARTDRLESKHSEGSATLQLVVKVFNVHQMKRHIHAFQVPVVAADATLTAFEVLEDGTQIALGFNTGLVLLFKGDFLREGTMGRSLQPTMLHQSHSHPVSGLRFKYTIAGAERAVRLFVVFDKDTGHAPPEPVVPASVATAGILVFDTSVRTENRKPPVVLDERGAAPHCSALMKEAGELVVGRHDGVFAYSSEDRGGAAGFEGPKQCVATIGRYILVAAPGVGKAGDRTAVTIYDFRNKITPYSKPLPAGDTVQFVLVDGDVAYIVTSRWSILRLKEKDTASKVAVLLTKSNYPQAISLAMEEQWDVTERVNLFKQYGDYLLKNADYEGAIKQYSATIGYVPSSYVIRKFLDTQRLNHLTFYLEKLHEAGAATSEHTTLLLTCYTRMKDDRKLEQFISAGDDSAGKTQSTSTDSNDSASKKNVNLKKARLTFDVEVALSTLQDAGYADYGMQLARMHNEHDWYLRIQLNRTNPDYDDALVYLSQLACNLPLHDVVPYILRYGRRILEHKMFEFVNLLTKICTGQVSPQELGLCAPDTDPGRSGSDVGGGEEVPQTPTSPTSSTSPTSPQAGRRNLPAPEDFIPVFTDHPHLLRTLLEEVYQAQRVPISTKMTNTLLELLLEEWSSKQQELLSLADGAVSEMRESIDPLIHTDRASLDEVVVEPDGEKVRQVKQALAKAEETIMNLLTQPKPNYTEAHVLLLVQMYGFKQGELLLLDRLQSVDLLLRRYIEVGDDRAILKLLRKEGRNLPDLYVHVLRYFVESVPLRDDASGDDQDEHERWADVRDVLSLIEQQQTLPPVRVISILAQHPELPIQVASKYIKMVLQQDSAHLQELEEGVKKVKREVASIPRGPHDVRRKSRQHGEDEDGDVDEDEDKFMAERRKWEDIRAKQIERTGDHEAFFSELEHSTDGFATIASHFGKVMIN